MKFIKNKRRLQILEALSSGVRIISDLVDISLLSYSDLLKMRNNLFRPDEIKSKILKTKNNFNQFQKEKKIINIILFKLKKDGLVRVNNKNGVKLISITSIGKNLLEKLRLKKKDELPTADYKRQIDDDLKIVIFDIPEEEKRKRWWLRNALQNLNFKMLQKSVWIGKSFLPEKFIKDLSNLRLLSYVKIFSVNKNGNIFD